MRVEAEGMGSACVEEGRDGGPGGGPGRRQSFGGWCDKVQGRADQWQAGQEGSSVAKGK